MVSRYMCVCLYVCLYVYVCVKLRIVLHDVSFFLMIFSLLYYFFSISPSNGDWLYFFSVSVCVCVCVCVSLMEQLYFILL